MTNLDDVLSRAKQPKKTTGKKSEPQQPSRGKLILREGALIGWLAICVYLLVAFVTHSPEDPGWSHTGNIDQVNNAAGPLGAWLSDVFFSLLGYMSYLFPILLVLRAWNIFRLHQEEHSGFDGVVFSLRALGLVLVMVCATSLASLHYGHLQTDLPFGVGGILGTSVSVAAASCL